MYICCVLYIYVNYKVINADKILFIKLGEKGCYEKDCIMKDNTIKLGYREISNELCMANDWEQVSEQISSQYRTKKGPTTSHKNQIKKFYTEPKTTMWITFFEAKLWYCFADEEIIFDEVSKTKSRKTVDGWHCKDNLESTLFIQELSGKLSKVQAFRGTICNVTEKSYLLNKINNIQSPLIENVNSSLALLKTSIQKLIQELSPQDFEVFVDLIFRSSGWSRVGVLGNTIKTLDIELLAPVTGERALVQIKSQSDIKTYNEYEEKLNIVEYDKLFFVTHTPCFQLKRKINDTNKKSRVQIWNVEKLADLSINAGLITWLINISD